MTDHAILLKSYILKNEVTKANFNFIMDEFAQMQCTAETYKLWRIFKDKYSDEIIELLIEPERFERVCEIEKRLCR